MRLLATLALCLGLAVTPALSEDESSLMSGQAAPDGRGIASSLLGSDGHLVINYTDGSKADVGVVVGPKGDPGDTGLAGERGPAGDPGLAGSMGPRGSDGAAGAAGAAGPAGATGPKGEPGAAGPKGDTGAQGSAGPQGATGAQGTAGAKGDTGPQGTQGVAGPAGPKASQFICNATIGETTLIAVSSGIRSLTGITCTGVLATDVLEVYPTSPSTFPAGYAVHHALPTAANTIRAVISVPALTVGASYSIPVAVYSVNR